jgi:flagellar basal-body rod protein FlgC
MEEMANMIMATRAYEANVSAMNATKDMAMTSLELGR